MLKLDRSTVILNHSTLKCDRSTENKTVLDVGGDRVRRIEAVPAELDSQLKNALVVKQDVAANPVNIKFLLCDRNSV